MMNMNTEKLNERRKTYEGILTRLGYRFDGIEQEDSIHIRVDYINSQKHSDLHIYFDDKIERSYAYLFSHDGGKTYRQSFSSLNNVLEYLKFKSKI